MANDTIKTEVSHSPTIFPALFEQQQQMKTLLRQVSEFRKCEVDELLFRHYDDKSWIDQWSSWCYELSFWQTSSLSVSVIGIAGLSGVILGMTLPFIALASCVLYFGLDVLRDHEIHRLERGKRLATETKTLTEQLDTLKKEFCRIGDQMLSTLEQFMVQVQEMMQHNELIQERTTEHQEEQTKLQNIITIVSDQSDHAKVVQEQVTAVAATIAAGLKPLPEQISQTSLSLTHLETTCKSLASIAALMGSSEVNIHESISGLKECIRVTTTQSDLSYSPDRNSTLKASELALSRLRAFRKEHQQTMHSGTHYPM